MITWCVTVPLFWAIIECFDGRCPGTYFVERGGEWDFFICVSTCIILLLISVFVFV